MNLTTRKATVALAAVAVTVAAPAAAQAKTVIGSGSSVAEPYLQSLFAGYHKTKAGRRLHFVYTADGGNTGVKDVQQGRSQFAVNTRPPLPSDAGTTWRQLFLDGLCVDVNASNTLSNLTIGQASDIFLGNVTNWAQVPGSGLNATIDPVGRDATAGTYTFFQSAVLNGKTQSSRVNAAASDGLVANAVSKDPNGIGYIGYAHAREKGIKRLALNGVTCEPKNVKSQRYPLSRYIWFVTPSSGASADAVAFARWIRTSVDAGKILSKAGAVPAFNRRK